MEQRLAEQVVQQDFRHEDTYFKKPGTVVRLNAPTQRNKSGPSEAQVGFADACWNFAPDEHPAFTAWRAEHGPVKTRPVGGSSRDVGGCQQEHQHGGEQVVEGLLWPGCLRRLPARGGAPHAALSVERCGSCSVGEDPAAQAAVMQSPELEKALVGDLIMAPVRIGAPPSSKGHRGAAADAGSSASCFDKQTAIIEAATLCMEDSTGTPDWVLLQERREHAEGSASPSLEPLSPCTWSQTPGFPDAASLAFTADSEDEFELETLMDEPGTGFLPSPWAVPQAPRQIMISRPALPGHVPLFRPRFLRSGMSVPTDVWIVAGQPDENAGSGDDQDDGDSVFDDYTFEPLGFDGVEMPGLVDLRNACHDILKDLGHEN